MTYVDTSLLTDSEMSAFVAAVAERNYRPGRVGYAHCAWSSCSRLYFPYPGRGTGYCLLVGCPARAHVDLETARAIDEARDLAAQDSAAQETGDTGQAAPDSRGQTSWTAYVEYSGGRVKTLVRHAPSGTAVDMARRYADADAHEMGELPMLWRTTDTSVVYLVPGAIVGAYQEDDSTD